MRKLMLPLATIAMAFLGGVVGSLLMRPSEVQGQGLAGGVNVTELTQINAVTASLTTQISAVTASISALQSGTGYPQNLFVPGSIQLNGTLTAATGTVGTFTVGQTLLVPVLNGSRATAVQGSVFIDSVDGYMYYYFNGWNRLAATFNVQPASFQITTNGLLPPTDVTWPFNATLSTSGGTGTVTFSTTTPGALPGGVSFSTAGAFSGSPTATGNYNFAVTASDSAGNTATQTFTIVVNPIPTFVTTSLPAGTLSQAYSATISTAGGTGAITLTVAPGLGNLPSGLTLSSSGVLSGTPTSTGTFSFVVGATDTIPAGSSQTYTLIINPMPSMPMITMNPSNVTASLGATVSFTAAATGYPTPSVQWQQSADGGTTWAAVSGPTSTTLTLTLQGVTASQNGYQYEAVFTNSTGSATSSAATLSVSALTLQITTTGLNPSTWDANLAYSATISATGGTGTVTFSATGLPQGMSLGSAGTLSGAASATGAYKIAVTASDSVGDTATQTYSLTINPAVTIGTKYLSGGTSGQSYSAAISTSGGTGTITLSVSQGSLPPGIALNSSGLSGTPTQSGTYNFTIQAADQYGSTATQSYSLKINP